MFVDLLVASTVVSTPLPSGTEVIRILRSPDGSSLTVDLRRRRKVTCYDQGPYSAACRVIGGRLCCESGGWLPPPHNRVEEVVRSRVVIDCSSRRFDEKGDGRGWQPLEKDAAIRAIAADHCAASQP